MKRFNTLVLGLVLLFTSTFCSAVEIVVPGVPVQPGWATFIPIKGDADTLKTATLDWAPKEGVVLIKLFTEDGSPLLVFQGTKPGKYTITVSNNTWSRDLLPTIGKAEAAKIDPVDLARLKALAPLAIKYPHVETQAEIVVAGAPDKPPPDKPPPVDPYDPEKVTQVTYVYEQRDNSVPGPVASGLVKLNSGGVIIATEFEQNNVNGFGQTPAQYVVALKAAREKGLPCLVFQAGSKVVKVVPNPQLESDVVKTQSRGGK